MSEPSAARLRAQPPLMPVGSPPGNDERLRPTLRSARDRYKGVHDRRKTELELLALQQARMVG